MQQEKMTDCCTFFAITAYAFALSNVGQRAFLKAFVQIRKRFKVPNSL